ncbi:MAG: stage II sporulation protein M [Planctomycetota bacterium]
MSRGHFEKQNTRSWNAFKRALFDVDRRKRVGDAAEFLSLYRRVCQNLALARTRHYGADLEAQLNRLALRGHQHLYARRMGVWSRIVHFVGAGFPQDVRRNHAYLWASLILFGLPFVGFIVAIQLQPDLAYSVLPPEALRGMEQMYDPAQAGKTMGASVDERAYMFGFYVYNNVSIAFRTFAAGIACGVGSLYFAAYNGVVLGAVSGHLTQIGYGETFWPFVIGHGSFELTALVLATQAGLKIGWSLVAPGQRTRGRALLEETKDSMGIVYGFTAFLVIAAFLEAFWSPWPFIPPAVKYAVGSALWAGVISYLAFAGRGQ